jgi:dTDP-4-dehydrorhamnose reductase
MLGRAVRDVLQEDHEVVGVDLTDFDLALEPSIQKMVAVEPDTICHLAAFTDVDGCESDPERAYRSNVVATRNVALACKRAECPMLYVSTDYVFNGESRVPYDVGDRANPLNMYGRTKLIGEWFVEPSAPCCMSAQTMCSTVSPGYHTMWATAQTLSTCMAEPN